MATFPGGSFHPPEQYDPLRAMVTEYGIRVTKDVGFVAKPAWLYVVRQVGAYVAWQCLKDTDYQRREGLVTRDPRRT